MKRFDFSFLDELRPKLENHAVYGAVRSLEDLRIFMSHHVYSVWDFMSVVKYLQQKIAPSVWPWAPRGNPAVRYFINQLVLEEESDIAPEEQGKPTYSSHFELYCRAMEEVGADPSGILAFVESACREGMEAAFSLDLAPPPSTDFVKSTFAFLDNDRPHEVAAAFAMGREHIIPCMFRSFLERTGITEREAPFFHYYLKRHIHLDEDFHGPISILLLEELCAGNEAKLAEAQRAASIAVDARIRFWDGILHAIESSGPKA